MAASQNQGSSATTATPRVAKLDRQPFGALPPVLLSGAWRFLSRLVYTGMVAVETTLPASLVMAYVSVSLEPCVRDALEAASII